MFKRRRATWVIAVSLLLLALAPSAAFAANGLVSIVPPSCNGSGGCQSVCDIATLAQNILNDAIFLAIFLAAILFAYAGAKMVMSPASATQMAAGRKLMTSVLVGFLIILCAWLIVNAIMSLLFTGSAGLPWNKIC